MSEPIQFFASVYSVQGGDEEVRIVLHVEDSTADLAAAVQMLGKLNRVLRVTAYIGKDADALVDFAAAIPQMKTGIQFHAKKPPVIKLDIPASDGIKALRLVGYSERLIRFEVADEGEAKANGRKTQQKPKAPKAKTPHGDMWRELILSGFIDCPGVKEAVNELPKSGYEKPRDLFRQFFSVESISRFVGPKEIFERFPPNEFPQVKTMVEQALRKAGEKQCQQQ